MQVSRNSASQFLTTNNMTFVIPVYQRNYDWTEENCKQLWNDILDVADKDSKTHFLGTICSKCMTGHEKTIIDGQQRLTTITLLMKAMHDTVEDPAFREDIDKNYLRNKGYGVPEHHRVKLHLNRRDDAVYNRLLEFDGAIPPEELSPQDAYSRVYRNYRFFFGLLENMDEAAIAAVYSALDRIIIVDLDVENENPQEIFESLNSTGVDLTDVDLLRNYLLMSLDYQTQTRLYDSYWYKIEQNVGPDNMVRFFVDYLIYSKKSDAVMVRGRRGHINERNLYAAFKSHYLSIPSLPETSDTASKTEMVLKDMYEQSKVYRRLVFSGTEDMNSLPTLSRIIYSIVEINQAQTSRPVLMHVMRLLEDGSIDEGTAVDLLRACLSLIFRAKVCGKTGINGQFSGNLLQRLDEIGSPDVVDSFWRALTSGRGRYAFPTDDEFMEALTAKPMYEVLRAKGAKYLLYSLDRATPSSRGLPRYDDANITVEHVMPQRLSAEWEAALGDEAALHEDYLNKLGNLALTSYNAEMSNRAFPVKQQWYREAGFAYTRRLGEEECWSIESIRRRGRLLAERSLEVWPMPEKYQSTQAPSNAGSRRSRFRFSKVDIHPGEVVLFNNDPAMPATVLDDSRVRFRGEEYFLSPLAQILLNRGTTVQGPLYFYYEGERLSDRRIRFDEMGEEEYEEE